MSSPLVVAELVRQLAELHAWGRDGDGWWALVSWSVYGRLTSGANGYVYCSAWVPATTVKPSKDPVLQERYIVVERFDLPASRSWPTPAQRPHQNWHHYGPVTWTPGPPPGITAIGQPPPLRHRRA